MLTEHFILLRTGEYRDGFLWIESDPDSDGFFVIVRKSACHNSPLLFSSWQPGLEALNSLLRDYDWHSSSAQVNS
jgi:hypothetical protein